MGLLDFFKKRETVKNVAPEVSTTTPDTKISQTTPANNPPEPVAEQSKTITYTPKPSSQQSKDNSDREQRLAEKYRLYNEIKNNISCMTLSVAQKGAPKLTMDRLNDISYSSITKKSSLEKLGDFVVIDTETTGLQPSSCEIIDIAAIRFRNFLPVEKISMLLSSKKPIPEDITKINGITNEMVLGYPHFSQIADSLVEFIGDDALVGHNLPFDLRFIVKHGADVTSKKRKYYDTLEISQKTLKKVRYKYDKEFDCYDYDPFSGDVTDYKLKTLCVSYGIITETLHRAEADALATGFLFEKLAKQRTGHLE